MSAEAGLPEPTAPASSRVEVWLRYLDYFRGQVLAKVAAVGEQDRRASILPSGWSPIELVRHLTWVERRWLQWGFRGEAFADPWADERDGRWYVGPDDPTETVLRDLADQAAVTTAVISGHGLDDIGQPGDRWNGAAPPSLERVMFHLVQEYARHLGQLDVVVELRGGPQGE